MDQHTTTSFLGKKPQKIASTFMTIVSHEIKGPLSNTIYILQLLKEKLTSGVFDLQECFALIDAEIDDASRGIDTINYLLDFLNLDINKTDLEKKTNVDIRQELMKIIDLFDQHNKKNLHFKIVKNMEFPFTIKINPIIFDVVNILLSNAVKYSHQNGTITIELSHEQTCLKILIMDEGLGINQETMKGLFAPLFNRENKPSNSVYCSPAIKLSYARKIVEFLGGSLSIDNQAPGVQAGFTIPYENAPFFNDPIVSTEHFDENDDVLITNTKLNILVVEDNPLTSYLLKKELLDMGHDASTAPASFEAKAEIQNGNYDVIFTDISLPGVDGVELKHAVGEPEQDKPIFIAITSHDSEKDTDYFLDQGFVSVINKPFSREDIRDCVRTIQKALSYCGVD